MAWSPQAEVFIGPNSQPVTSQQHIDVCISTRPRCTHVCNDSPYVIYYIF